MNQILEILQNIRPEFDFSTSNNYFADGMLDSFDMVLLVNEIEKVYNISIRGLDIIPENFNSLSSIEQLLAKYGVQL